MSVPVEYRRRGQAVWMDSISDRMITSGGWAAGSPRGRSTASREPDDLRSGGGEGRRGLQLGHRAARGGRGDASRSTTRLTRHDIARAPTSSRRQHAANPEDGWISLESPPSLALHTEETVAEAAASRGSSGAERLHQGAGDAGGIPAIRRLIGNGISINIR